MCVYRTMDCCSARFILIFAHWAGGWVGVHVPVCVCVYAYVQGKLQIWIGPTVLLLTYAVESSECFVYTIFVFPLSLSVAVQPICMFICTWWPYRFVLLHFIYTSILELFFFGQMAWISIEFPYNFRFIRFSIWNQHQFFPVMARIKGMGPDV